MTQSAADIIRSYNAGREPERLAIKLNAMRESPFGFLRGSTHLFWQRLKQAGVPTKAPPAWCSGDQHLENFGTYRGDNGLVYFDLNDFDEAALAPCEWDLIRLLTSILIAAPTLGLSKPEARGLSTQAAEAYRAELATGKARWIERATATGAIDELMTTLKGRQPSRLIERRTVLKKGKRRLDFDDARLLPATDAERAALADFTTALGKARGVRGYFELIDAARRVAGTGSLGLPRYVLLLEGAGSPDGNALLDLKAAQASSLAPCARRAQPAWKDDAERIVAVQQRCQAIAPAQLAAVTFQDQPFVLRELQPDADRLKLARVASDRKVLAETFQTMGQLLAWSHLRSSGRDGAASADDFVHFARDDTGFAARLTALAKDQATTLLVDYKDFCGAPGQGQS